LAVMGHILKAVPIGCMVKLYSNVAPCTDIWASEKDSVFDVMEAYIGGSISRIYGKVYGPLL
jgi:hypothetical protein